MSRRTVLAATALVAATLLPAAASPAAVTIGNSLSGTPSANQGSYCGPVGLCTGTNLILSPAQTAAGGLTSPIDGVVVRWRVESGSLNNAVALRVLRPFSGATFTGAGTSSTGTTTGAIDEFSSQVPIKAGDGVGLNIGTSALVWETGGTAASPNVAIWGNLNGFPTGLADGTTATGDTVVMRELLVQADVEPDCDSDGLGDETQDADLSPCQPPEPPDTAAPDTTITKGPQDKTKKKQATFEFTSTEPGSSFECSIDGAGFSPCISPLIVTVGKGTHSFQVRARDGAGNVDAAPATDDWKVKKKKKKK